jgi:REP element-mobilizing transposase RayT
MVKKRRRKNSLRLRGFNYQEPRMYAIVLNTVDRMHLFGQVIDAVMYPSPIGQLVLEHWRRIPQIHPDIVLDEYQLMPDHVHAIIGFTAEPVRQFRPSVHSGNAKADAAQCLLPHSLRTLLLSFKRGVTMAVRELCSNAKFELWQANFYDAIIRSNEHLQNERAYILRNPQAWQEKWGNPMAPCHGVPCGDVHDAGMRPETCRGAIQ